jgi:hypothetical protein
MDTAYWNATLRAGISDFTISADTVHVLWSGMIALSLSGNRISGSKLALIGNVLKKNFWFLGINMANNLLTMDEIKTFLSCLASNTSIHAITLGGNPGFTHELAKLSTDIISRNESRLARLPPHLEYNLRKWIDMQLADAKYTNYETNPSAPDISFLSGPTTSHIPDDTQNTSAMSSYPMPFLDVDEEMMLMNEVDDIGDYDLEHATPTPSEMLQRQYAENDNPRISRQGLPIEYSPRDGIDGR